MAKTCIRVEACNIGSSERHNLRSKELDYIRPELTHRNEQWVECSIAEVHRDITEKYKEATGQGLQKKATPIREGVIVISEETTIQQLQDLAEKLEERFGVHASKSTPIRMKAQTYGTERKKHGNRTIMRT